MKNYKLDYYTLSDKACESIYINRVLGAFAKKLIDEDKYGQCIFEIALMLDDLETMMNRLAIDGNAEKANRKIHFPVVEDIMKEYMNLLAAHDLIES